jgi:arylsulfatase
VPLFVSDKFKGKSGRGLYGDVIMEIDWSVGQLIQTLKEEGLEDDTLVIFTSDNGPWLAYGNHAGSAYPLREGKGTAWEGGQREPFIAQYPKSFLKGKTLDQPLMAIDLLPTIAELTGAPLPQKTIDGNSALSLFEGSSQESPQDTYFFYYRVNELHGLRHKNWKMYFPHNYRTLNGGEAGTNGQAGRYNYVDMEEVELYNLDTDVSEKNNVAEQQPEIVATMTALAEEMRQELGDALTEQKGTGNREPGKIPRHKTE